MTTVNGTFRNILCIQGTTVKVLLKVINVDLVMKTKNSFAYS